MNHPEIQEEIRTALYEQGFTPEFAAKTLMGAMRATVVRGLPNRKGKPVLHRFPDHRTRLQGFDRACRLTGAIENKQGYGADAEFEPDRRRTLGREYLSESERKVANPYAQLSPTDRMLARSFTEKVIAIVKLGGGNPADVVARILARTKESSGIGSTHGPSQAGSGQRDRPAFGRRRGAIIGAEIGAENPLTARRSLFVPEFPTGNTRRRRQAGPPA